MNFPNTRRTVGHFIMHSQGAYLDDRYANQNLMTGDLYKLPTPNFAKGCDFWNVVLTRRSRRNSFSRPIEVLDLSEILAATMRQSGCALEVGHDIALSPVISAGGIPAIRTIVITHGIPHIDNALWLYATDEHELYSLITDSSDFIDYVDQTILNCIAGPSIKEQQRIAFLFFGNLSKYYSKYSTASLGLIYKTIGAAMQQFSLVSHALGFAGCPIGGGDGRAFEKYLEIRDGWTTYGGAFCVWSHG